MTTDEEKSKMLAELIWNKRMELTKEKHRMIRDNEMSRWLGVNVGSFNQWINQNRLPGFDNVLKLSVKLGPEVFDIMGYDKAAIITDPELMFVANQWKLISEESRKWIINLIKEKTDAEYNQEES
jgi:hypothetical protein